MSFFAILFLVLGIFCFGYLAVIISYSGIETAFLWFWILGGIGSFLLSGIIYYLYVHKIDVNKPIKIGFVTVFLLSLSVFLLVEGIIISYGNTTPEKRADYVIVLGAQVRGKAISKALKERLDTAYKYLVDNQSSKVIVSGGQGRGEDITEAKAMQDYLITKGIKKERIITEDQSTNTYENIRYSMKLMEPGEHSVLLVTNRFHVYRGVSIAKKLGIKNPQGLGAPVDDIMTISYYVREFLAVIKDKLVGNI